MSTAPRVADPWAGLLADAARPQIEADLIPFLPRQRWFAGKSRAIRSAAIVDGSEPIAALPRVRLLLVEVRYDSGRPETYFLPLGVAQGEGADRLLAEAPARVVRRLDDGVLVYDALGDPEVGAALLEMIGGGGQIRTDRGAIAGTATSAFAAARGPASDPLPARLAAFEQSNSSVVYGDRLLLKIFRRLEPGVNPDFEIGKFFADRTKFRRVPTTAGSLAYRPAGGGLMMVGILQGLVANSGSGWDHALGLLKDLYESTPAERAGQVAAIRCPRSVRDQIQWEPDDAARELVGPYLADAALLGRRTAEMHLALASDKADPAFRPEPISSFDLMHLADEVRHQAGRAQEMLRAGAHGLPAAVRADAEAFLGGADALVGQVDALAGGRVGASKIRCHGDYHLGQVLRAGDDYILLDFEGEPAKSLADRLAKQSAMKDVAGMIRSFDYAAFAALFAHAEGHPDRFAALAPLAQFWRSWVASAYLREYLAVAGDAPFIPRDPAALARLLEVQLLDKALYELLYELNNRPDWVRIPLQGINALRPGDLEADRRRHRHRARQPHRRTSHHADQARSLRPDRFRRLPAQRGDALPLVREARAPTSGRAAGSTASSSPSGRPTPGA